MYLFVDESGDTVVGPNGTPFLVVTAVIFETYGAMLSCSDAIDNLRKKLNWEAREEFKFSNLNFRMRLKFIDAVLPLSFLYCTFILDKRRLDGKGFKYHKSCYKFAIRMLFNNMRRYMQDATVIIDKSGDSEFSEEIEKYVKRNINTPSSACHVKELRMKDSQDDNNLQLADIVCGSIARLFKTEKKDHRKYRPRILLKEAGFQKWPSYHRK